MLFEPSAIDRHFADFICREAGDTSPWLKTVVQLASNAVGNGHICLNLADIADKPVQVGWEPVTVPSLEILRNSLEKTQVVGRPGDFRPLVLDSDDRLYLYRYWKYERDLAAIILEKAKTPCNNLDEGFLAEGLRRFFPSDSGDGPDWQKVAALAAVRKGFCVISGGPGTGKTSTVVKIIALLLEQGREAHPRIALAAPTGKSASRLKESVRLMKEKLDCSADVRDLIPDEVSTIHRLLGPMGGSARFRYSDENQLPYDAVIVDEASMVALPLMAKLAGALRRESRLILLGDRDQLASVEAGAVMGDICGGGRSEPFSGEFADLAFKVAGEKIPAGPAAESLLPLTDSLVILKKNYRFGSDSGIGEAGRAVNAGDGDAAVALLKGEKFPDIAWHGAPGPDGLGKALSGAVIDGYSRYLTAGTPEEALKSFDAFRVLCALRRGPYGMGSVNALVQDILAAKGLIDPATRWYRGRPVMITVNDYGLKLFNGDVGIVFPDPEADGNPRVFFPAPDGGVRKFSPARLPEHETVYAMTIHKSQGSEFGRVLLLLPDTDTQLLTRELIYTGITRAREFVAVWGREDVFRDVVTRKIDRKSGLKEMLWR